MILLKCVINSLKYASPGKHILFVSVFFSLASATQMQRNEQMRFPALGIPSSQIQSEEESSNLIKPHKPLSPLNASRSHQALHKELQMTHKRLDALEVINTHTSVSLFIQIIKSVCVSDRRVAQDGKNELQRALEKRKWEQKMKARQDQDEAKRNMSPLQQELLKRQQRLENVNRKNCFYSHTFGTNVFFVFRLGQ